MQNNLVDSRNSVCFNHERDRQSNVSPLPISILEEIVRYKRQEVTQRQKYWSLKHLKLLTSYAQPPVDFLAALCESNNPLSLIAEVKKASPSKGTICENFDPVAIAQAYEQGGATCLSVLTDQKFFQGSFDYLTEIRENVSLPLLCKEFVINPYQIYLARASGADAILLIAAILDDQELQTFLDLIHDLGMTALVEVHTLVELDRVLSLKNLRLIGINNRNLADFTIDLKTTQRLIQQRQEQIFKLGLTVVSESGLHTSADLESVAKAGVHAVLVGESLVKQSDPKQAVINLLGASLSIGSPNAKSTVPLASPNKYQPDSSGRFGRFGSRYVPETLILPLCELETAYLYYRDDKEFQHEMINLLRDYAGRPTPLYFAKRLTAHYARLDGTGPQIFLKREDLNHTGSHKINSALAQVLLAKRMGKRKIATETGDGQHGVATASACARLDMPCTIFMGIHDIDQHPFNVMRMQLMGADLRSVDGGHGRLKDAVSEAIRDCVSHLDSTYYLPGSVIGPHPYPMMVRDFQAIIGRETRVQCQEQWQGKPDILLACIGGGSNAIGLFYEYLQDATVRLIGVEAAGKGINSGKHAATLTQGKLGVFHGAMSNLLQVEDGQTLETYSICSGLNYPSVGPELSYLKEIERVEYHSVTDQQAVDAFLRLSKLEGIIPALETAHAIAYLETLCPQLSGSPRIIINCSGRGDKDVQMVAEISGTLT